jgi:hypothetical protein
MNTRSQLVCAWIAVIAVVLIVVGFVVADYIPPPKASDSALKLANFYRDHPDRTRAGIFILLFAVAGFGTLVAGISIVMARIEGRRPVLAAVQAVAGAAGFVCLLLFVLLLAAAAFRPERSPEITQTLHDAGWFMAFLAVTPFVMQAVSIAAVVLGDDRPTPVLPRWFGYFNGWMALLLLPGALLMFFKTGPFSYHGLIGFWVPLGAFGAWMLGMAWGIRRSALGETG